MGMIIFIQQTSQKCFIQNKKMKEQSKNTVKILALLIIMYMEIWGSECAPCARQRCCSLSTCTSVYCQQKSSQTWISTENYDKYQYTKLVMADNQCKPCAYSCKRCSAQSACTQCYDGYYIDGSGACKGCDYKCLKCQVVNSISKCSACEDGSYLDSSTLTCKLCPVGAKTCVDATTIVECESGYLKSSNSLFCTACTTNCTSCPASPTNCSVCAGGYYISSGLCRQCNISNCDICTSISNTLYCTTCSSAYYRSSSTTCSPCPLNCKACTSATVCTTCKTGYYIQGGGCARVATTIDSCDVYSNTTSNGTNKCSTCMTGSYLAASGVQCVPCSITCSACYGDHFGRCTACASNAKLFNQMCIPLSFLASNKVQLYYTPSADANSRLTGGTPVCSSLLYSGTTINLQLSSLSAYKLVIQYRLFTDVVSQAYNVSLNSSTNSTSVLTTNSSYNTTAQVSSALGYQLCSAYNMTNLYYAHINSVTFTSVKLNNTLSFASVSSFLFLYLAEVLVVAYKCSPLCLECSQSQCYTCMTANLYTQDAYCVYTCANGYYTYELNKQCVRECPLATYALLTNVSCMACVSPCMTCLNDKYCLSCIQGYFLSTINNTCQKECPYRYFGSVRTQKCEQCVGRCNQCINDEQCTTCQVGFLENATCVDTCQDGYYSNITTLKCESCQSACLTCLFRSDYCLSCPSGKLFYNNSCVSTCPTTYYADSATGSCLSCAYPCEQCQAASTQCLSCVDGYLFNTTCLSSCPAQFYENNVLLSCQPCSSVCTKCYSSANICLQCISGYKLHGSACLSTCPDGYYPQTLPNYNMTICSLCTGLCQNCLNQTYCLSCNSNFLADNGSGLCVRSSLCSMSFFANIESLKCQQCDSSCLTCYYSSITCTSCNAGAILYNNTCLPSCPSQYFYNTSSTSNSSIQVCAQCEQPCLTCLNQTQCLYCVAGYKYSSVTHVCSSTCSIGSFFNKTINDCQACSTDCLTCDTATFCYACKSSTYLFIVSPNQNKCTSKCPDQYYADGLSCMACLYPCDLCSSSIDCLSCQNGVLYQNRCLSGCPQSTYMDTTNNICKNCQGNCLTCKEAPTKCTLCVSGYYLIQSQHACVSSCPDGTYPFLITKQCASCPSSCSKCTNSSYCTACVSGKTYLNVNNHTCTQFCATGYYSNTSTGNCEVCSTKCLTCATSASQCLTCAPGYLLVRLPNSTHDCATSCPSSYYNDSNACYHCVFPCQSCTSASHCTTCAPGTYLHIYSQSCLMSCPLGTYYSSNLTTPSCVNCVSPCQTCSNSSACISCATGFLLLEGACVTECPVKYYADASGICNRCYGLCQTCAGKYECLTCQTGFSYSGYCYSACPPGTYASQKTGKCLPCQSPCLECAVNAKYCKRCQYSMFAYRGQCSPSCPIGTYQATQVCLSCQFPCVKCSNQFTCEQCIGGYLLYMRTSCIENVQKCPNDLYKMDSKECVPSTWCPVHYFRDEDLKTCSKQCSRQKYVNIKNKTCLDGCASGEYVGKNMVCQKWTQQPPTSLMTMSSISFIKSSQVHIVITFNQSINWLQNSQQLYSMKNLEMSRRLLSPDSISTIVYNQDSEQELVLQIKSMPYSAELTLPAHLVASSVSGYNLQTPTISVKLPKFTAYSYEQAYTGSIMKQFSEGISWFIILFSMFFVFMNRLSDSYILWDTAQLLYLLIFLDMQYPSNLNDFFVGLSNIHFLFVPSIFAKAAPTSRLISSSPFYAYSFDNSFLRTAGSPILLIAIAIAIYLILKSLQLLSTKVDKIKQKMQEYPTVKGYIFKGLLRYRWHHTSDIIFLSYDIVVLFAVAEIVNISQNPNNIASNTICAIILIIYLAFPCFVSYKLYKHYSNISKGKMVANLQCFYRGIEKTNKFGISLIVLRYFRKLTYCVIIGVFTKQPMFALPILMFTSVLMGLFIFINKPFKKRLSNIVTVATEIILVFLFMLIALIQFGQDNFNTEAKIILGWVCCGLLLILLFTLIFEIFCKSMFYLQPEKQKQSGNAVNEKQVNNLTQKFSQQYLRQKAGQFFDKIFPKLKQKFNFDDSQEALNQYQKGDSENSENNEERQKNWGLMSESEEKKSDQFRHYGNQDDNESETKDKKQEKAPNYLIRCVKQIQ